MISGSSSVGSALRSLGGIVNVSAGGKPGLASTSVPELCVKPTVNASAVPCVSELSATVIVT